MIDMHLVLDERDPTLGAAAYRFESGACKLATWGSRGPVRDPLALAQDMAARVLDSLMRDGLVADANSTRWPSVVAGTAALIRAWNEDPRGGGAPLTAKALTPLPPAVH